MWPNGISVLTISEKQKVAKDFGVIRGSAKSVRPSAHGPRYIVWQPELTLIIEAAYDGVED